MQQLVENSSTSRGGFILQLEVGKLSKSQGRSRSKEDSISTNISVFSFSRKHFAFYCFNPASSKKNASSTQSDLTCGAKRDPNEEFSFRLCNFSLLILNMTCVIVESAAQQTSKNSRREEGREGSPGSLPPSKAGSMPRPGRAGRLLVRAAAGGFAFFAPAQKPNRLLGWIDGLLDRRRAAGRGPSWHDCSLESVKEARCLTPIDRSTD